MLEECGMYQVSPDYCMYVYIGYGIIGVVTISYLFYIIFSIIKEKGYKNGSTRNTNKFKRRDKRNRCTNRRTWYSKGFS